MKFTNIIIFINNICSVGCATCNVSAKSSNKGVFPLEKIRILLNDVKKYGASKYLVWTGGEPFFTFDILSKGLKAASDLDLYSEVLTSGVWFKSNPEFLGELKNIANISLRISLDHEHNIKVSHDSILELTGELIRYGIDLNFTVRKIPGSDYDSGKLFKKIKNNFPEYYFRKKDDPRWIHNIPHIPIKKNDPYILRAENIGSEMGGCNFVYRDLVASWDCNIYPCCGLFSVKNFQRMSLMRINKGFLKDIESKIEKDWIFGVIGSLGPLKLMDNAGITKKTGSDLRNMNMCYICNSLFSL